MAESIKVAVYCRLACADNGAIELQKRQVLHFAAEHGDHEPAIYMDNGASGLNFKREAFMRLDDDIRAGRISAVYAHSLSRFGRNVLDVSYWLDGVRDKGVTVKTMDGYWGNDFDTEMCLNFRNIFRQLRNGGKRHGA